MVNLPCGQYKSKESADVKSNEAAESRTLYRVLTRTFIFEKNDRIKVAACELLSNLSLSETLNEMAEENDQALEDESDPT